MVRYRLRFVVAKKLTEKPQTIRRLTPSQRSLFVAVDEILRRGFEKNGALSKAKRRVAYVHDALAADWNLSVGTVRKLSERWIASAESLVRLILNDEFLPAVLRDDCIRGDKLLSWHIEEALTEFNHNSAPRESLQKDIVGEVNRTVPLDIHSYLSAHRRIPSRRRPKKAAKRVRDSKSPEIHEKLAELRSLGKQPS